MINSELGLSYLNIAIAQAQVNGAKEYDLDLCIAKFDLKEDDPSKFKSILEFIYQYIDYETLILESEHTFLIYLRNAKIHSSVLMFKNLNLALKLKFNTSLKNLAVTNLDKSDDLESLTQRLNSFYLKAKITKQDVYYGTKYIDYKEQNENILRKLIDKEKDISIYGIYKDSSIKINGEVVTIEADSTTIKAPKEYLSFLQKQPILYFEHKNIPDVMSANVVGVDYDRSLLSVGRLKFIDQSPLHRRNLRVEPPVPFKATLISDDFMIDGLVNDISINSLLFTTQLQNIEELEKMDAKGKKLKIQFKLENLHGNDFDIEMRVSVFKTMGNQLVLNTFATAEIQNIIKEYINMCYQHLLLQVQGKVLE